MRSATLVLQAYFSPEWQALLEISYRNFLAEVLAHTPLPAIMRFNTDRRLRLQLQQQVVLGGGALRGSRGYGSVDCTLPAAASLACYCLLLPP